MSEDYFEKLEAALSAREGTPSVRPSSAEDGSRDAVVATRRLIAEAEIKVTDAMIDAITQRVIERLAPDLVRGVVKQVVAEVTERLVREEIERIRNRA